MSDFDMIRSDAGGTTVTTSRAGPRDAERWRAVAERDPTAGEAFVYGVSSTGIFCRPTCPSRRPRRDRVAFFDSAGQARAAGYRPCKRCRPDDRDPVREKVLAACRYIDAQADRVPTLAELGRQVGLSPHHLQRTFRRTVGVTPREYADARRSERVRQRLGRGEDLLAATYGAGYGSSSRLYERAPQQLGMTPGRFRDGGRGERVRYAVVPSPLGRLLVAATDRGLCRVALGGTVRELGELLRRELPEAERVRDEAGLRPWVEPLLRYLGGELPLPDLPLDVRATAFQRRVWQALRAVPQGETLSYDEIARRIGHPSAARAVAGACAANPVALVVPCHRAVRKHGGAGGYRWGAERKRALLELERPSDRTVTTRRLRERE
jgi:AraC family transcriptional regulator of adaptative response/methylated-DNA-[protein]-cysteine methyltransferase